MIFYNNNQNSNQYRKMMEKRMRSNQGNFLYRRKYPNIIEINNEDEEQTKHFKDNLFCLGICV